ncbi:MAG TPA: ABC transporter ATP-binding protein, partial [Bacteroidales bacterium]|nr:ABC transporter ATP-binding protein [Bacteroidales bacterium]
HTPVLLLDEPCSNLDAHGIKWYRELLASYSAERLTIICSNHQENEYSPVDKMIEIEHYK